MEIVLLLTVLLAGSDTPIQKGIPQPNIAACEAEAHRYNAAKIPDNVVLFSSACIQAKPQLPGKDA